MKTECFLSQSLALLGHLIGSVAGVSLPFNQRRHVEIVGIKRPDRMKSTANNTLRDSVMPDAGALQPFKGSERRCRPALPIAFLNAWSELC